MNSTLDPTDIRRYRAETRELLEASKASMRRVDILLERVRQRNREIDLLDSGEYVIVTPARSTDNGRKRPFWKFW